MRAVKCRPNPSGLGRTAGGDCITASTRILKPVKRSPEETALPTFSILLQAPCLKHFSQHGRTNSRHWRDHLLCGASAHGPARKPGRARIPARLHARGPNYLCADTTTPPARASILVAEPPAM